MSTIVVAVILIAAIIAICLPLISIANKQKNKRMNKILKHFSELGTYYNLSFSSQEVLSNVIIGLDGIKRKILILEAIDTSFNAHIIDLNAVKHCSVKKYYGHIKPGGLNNNHLESFLEKISLHFEFQNGSESKEVVFYNHFENQTYQLSVLEQKALNWKESFEKMLNVTLKKIA
ncbi:MAG: hypothetical protein ACXWV9_05910 [Flavisolibacter sp.]